MTGAAFRLAGTGIGLPAKRVTSRDLDRQLGKPTGWLEAECGVAERYVCEHESQDDLAVTAATSALQCAGMMARDVDLIVFAASVGKQPIPATAPLIARRLGIAGGACAAFDVNATCLGFVTAFDLAGTYIGLGRYECALVVSSEIASRALPWASDPATAGLFGDGAAAAVLTQAGSDCASHIAAARFETYPEGYDLCRLAAGGTGIDYHRDDAAFHAASWFAMDGRELFKLSAKHFPGFVDRLLDAAGWQREHVDCVVPHQASPLALDHLVKRCRFPRERVIDIVATSGNQIAASIPMALHVARERGLVRQGAKVLLLGTSAGVSFGGLAIEI